MWEVNIVPVDACGTYLQVQMWCNGLLRWHLHGIVEYEGFPGVYFGSSWKSAADQNSYEKSSTCLKQSLRLPMLCSGQAQQVCRLFTANPSGWNSLVPLLLEILPWLNSNHLNRTEPLSGIAPNQYGNSALTPKLMLIWALRNLHQTFLV